MTFPYLLLVTVCDMYVYLLYTSVCFSFATRQYDWVLAGFKSDNGGNAHQFGTTCRQRTELTYIGAILVAHNGS